MYDVEVNQKTDMSPTEFEIRQNLRDMEREHFLNRLELDDDAIFDKKIDSVTSLEVNRLVDNRQPNLMFECETIDGHLVVEASSVGALQKASAKRRMNFHRRSNYSFRDLFVHLDWSSVSSASSVVESVVSSEVPLATP